MSVAISVENLSKYYRLGTINHGMLYKDIQSWMALKLGKQDPHAQIGADHYADRPEGFWALKDLNFDIQQGDRVGIIGKNGAGKSTLLKILSRITAPTEGVIKIKGRVTSLLEVGTGFHGELTGRENIYLNGAILGMKRNEITKKIDEIIAFSEIEQHIDTPVKRYSSGMYVRLAFAVAAHLDSEILIADEVLAVGDAAFQKKALGKMNGMSSDMGRTILFVSHNMAAVRDLCDVGMLLEKGRVVQFGAMGDVISMYLDAAVNKNKSVRDCLVINDQSIQIDEVLINGTESNYVSINSASQYLDIVVKGSLRRGCVCNLELFLKDEQQRMIAYYSPCHFVKNQYKEPGSLFIHECIFLGNLTKGKFYIDFNIGIPKQGFLASGPAALTVISDGVPALTSECHTYEQVGYFVLNGDSYPVTANLDR